MSSNFTVKWVWIFFACVQELSFHGFANSSFNYLCSDSSFQQSVFRLPSIRFAKIALSHTEEAFFASIPQTQAPLVILDYWIQTQSTKYNFCLLNISARLWIWFWFIACKIRPFSLNDHMVGNPPCWRASSWLFPHWDIKTKRPEPVKLDLPLFWCPSMGIIMSLPSSNGDFVPPDR